MPKCPICKSNLHKPPEDVQEWFRCEVCGTPLQISTKLGKILFGLSVALLLIACWSAFTLVPHLLRLKGLSEIGINIFVGSAAAIVPAIYAFLIRHLWNSKLFQPRPCDPYSSLNLSDACKKMRGNAPL